MTDTAKFEKALRLRHSGVIHKMLKKEPGLLRERPELRAPALAVFARSHGAVTAYGEKAEITQTDLYRLLDLARVGAVSLEEVAALVPKTEFRTAVVMTARLPGFATPSELVALAAKDGYSVLLPEAAEGRGKPSDFERDLRRAIAESPEIERAFRDYQTVHEVMTT